MAEGNDFQGLPVHATFGPVPSDAMWRQLIEWVPQLIWTCTPDGICDGLSREWSNFTGKPLAEMLGTQWLQYIHPDERESLASRWTRCVREGTEFEQEFRVRRHDGVYRWFHGRATPYRTDAGIIQKWFGSATDVTETYEARESLRAETERLATIAASSPGVVHSMRYWPDGHLSCTYAAPSLIDLCGIAPEELVHDAQPLFAATHPDDFDQSQAAIRASAMNLTPLRFDVRFIHQLTKREVWIEVHSRPVPEPDGGVTWHGVMHDITERKRTEAELRAERDRFERIASAVPGVIWVLRVNADGTPQFEYVSAAAEDLFDASIEDLLRDATLWARYIHPDDRERVSLAFHTAIGERRSFVISYRLVHPTRGELWLEACASQPDYPEPGVVRCHGYITDITERRRFEQALRESEERFSIAFQLSPGGTILVRNDDDVIVEANEAFLEMIGYPSEEVIGKPGQTLRLVSDDTARLALETAFRGDLTITNMELAFVRRNGAVRHGVMSVSPIEISGRHYSLGILTDITERKENEEALQEYRGRLLAALEGGGMSTWICQLDQGYLWWDDAAPKLWGRSREELARGRIEHLLTFIHPEDREHVADAFSAAMGEGTELRVEFRNQHPDGGLQWLSLRAQSHFERPGATRELTGVCIDVTARKLAEDSQLNSQKMEALGTLAGGIAHDFNNALLAIGGNARLALAETSRDHPAYASLQEIQRASERASDLVRHILTFSRQETARREVLTLQPVVEEALGLLRPAIPAMIEIHTTVSDEVPAVEANSTQLHQVVVNLVANAAQAIGSRTGRIEIRLDGVNVDAARSAMSIDLHEGRYARLSVCDNGVGMDKAIISRIFDPFFTTKGPGQGTGLGLSVVHGIVKNHGGAIVVSSEPGAGSTFSVYLPAATQAAVRAPEPQRPAPPSGGQRVLYIDDDEAVAFLSSRLLSRQGYRVSSFTDPQLALKTFRDNPNAFDVVVTDLSMPSMSGFDVTRQVLSVRPDLPVLMTSGYVRPEDQAAAQEAGVRELLLKPNTIDELGTTLARIFGEIRQYS